MAVRLLATAAVFVATLVAVATFAFFAVLFLAGPHAGLLPPFLEKVVLVLGWLSVIVLPTLAAVWVWRRLGRPVDDGE